MLLGRWGGKGWRRIAQWLLGFSLVGTSWGRSQLKRVTREIWWRELVVWGIPWTFGASVRATFAGQGRVGFVDVAWR
jgi:hypothetical protein